VKRPSTGTLHAFDELLLQIKKRLQDKGPASAETLELELQAPRVNVTFALEVLFEGKDKCVERIHRTQWTLTRAYMNQWGND
jgi:hypothetical protein